MLYLVLILIGFILGGLMFSSITLYFCNKSQKKTLEKVGKWVYNSAPKFIGKVEGGDYYKLSTSFLIEYQEYIDKIV